MKQYFSAVLTKILEPPSKIPYCGFHERGPIGGKHRNVQVRDEVRYELLGSEWL
jgi:hypothetical protein